MTPEQLMEERYILENLWPGCQWSVGAVFPANFGKFSDFPYLFRKLQWWEERNKKDMPKFVKSPFGEIMSVKGYDLFNKHIKFRSGTGLLENYIPSTEEEYLSQQGKGPLAD
jgi:hypothetical protein